MKISIIVGGKFHAFNLAQQLELRNCLSEIITSYPSLSLKDYGILKPKIKSIIIKEVLMKIFSKFSFIEKFFNYENFLCEMFAKKASKLINFEDLDIIVGWSSFSKETFIRLKNSNCIKVLERGSSHIQFQEKVLKKEYQEINIKPKLPSKKLIERELIEYELADFISVPSEFVKKTFIEYGVNENKIIKTPYGVDLKEFNFEDTKRPENDNFRIISTGTISVRKGSHILIDAFKELKLNNAELMFVGPIENDFKKILKRYDNLKDVIFIKKQNQKNLKYFYNNSDLFILNSIEDGFGMVIPQAMACGLPIICTENTGGSETVDNGINGYILPVKDSVMLKNKICEFYYNRSKLKKFSNNSLKKVNDLSWNFYGKEIIKKYKSLLKNNYEKNINNY